MKKFLSSSCLCMALIACQHTPVATHPADATSGEIQMAEMMGITVEELRNQSPEEHMQMMQEMMDSSDSPQVKGDETGMKNDSMNHNAAMGEGHTCAGSSQCMCHKGEGHEMMQAGMAPPGTVKKSGCGCGQGACQAGNT